VITSVLKQQWLKRWAIFARSCVDQPHQNVFAASQTLLFYVQTECSSKEGMFGRVCKAAYSVALILYTIMVLPFTHKTVAWSQGCLYAKARIYALFQSSDQGRAATE